jgi:tetratricopeptide (TPR) repeat protein
MGGFRLDKLIEFITGRWATPLQLITGLLSLIIAVFTYFTYPIYEPWVQRLFGWETGAEGSTSVDNSKILDVDSDSAGRDLVSGGVNVGGSGNTIYIYQQDPAVHNVPQIPAIAEASSAPSSSLSVDMLVTRAIVLRDAGRYEDAEAIFDDALDLAEARHGASSLEYASVLNHAGGAKIRLNKLYEAETMFRRCLDIYGRILGKDDREYAINLSNLAGVLKTTGRAPEALEAVEESVGIFERTGNTNSMFYAHSLQDYGVLLADLNRLEDSEAALRSAEDVARLTSGADSLDYAGMAASLGQTLLKMGKDEEGLEFLKASFDIYARKLSRDNPSYQQALRDLSGALTRLGRADEALALTGF